MLDQKVESEIFSEKVGSIPGLQFGREALSYACNSLTNFEHHSNVMTGNGNGLNLKNAMIGASKCIS